MLFVSATTSPVLAQNKIPGSVLAVLGQTKKNRHELEKAIQYYQLSGDSLKLKAIYFLIKNMDIHYSASYFWADSAGNRLEFNEQAYPDFASSIKGFDSLKAVHHKIHPVEIIYRDIDTIKSEYLINNIEEAFKLWKRPKKNFDSAFTIFCEYLLPYRISVEPLQDWRTAYTKKFLSVSSKKNEQVIDSTLVNFKSDVNNWFVCTYNLEKRKEPLPRLGPLQLLQRKKGYCEDAADLTVYGLRSMGIPTTVDFVPFWATSTGNHSLNAVYNENNKPLQYDILLNTGDIKEFIREPSKVLRTTYSKQENTLASTTNFQDIPEGILRSLNYVDVTNQYWKTGSVRCNFFRSRKPEEVIYACVFNGQRWEPTWWGKVKQDSVVFDNMCKGAIFLPMSYKDGKLSAVGFPIASGYDTTFTIIPDTTNRHSVTIKPMDNYLIFQPKKSYTLYFWDKFYWHPLARKSTTEDTQELTFQKVPKNALLLLIPEYSKKKERPFIITNDGKRLWW